MLDDPKIEEINFTRKNVATPKFGRRDGAAVDKANIEAFRHGFHGQVLLQGDAGYATARRIWNARA
jgi:hypothetical protein